MTHQEKQSISERLGEYCQRIGSQSKAANSLNAVGSATISQVLNGQWDLIADKMWRNIASQIGYDPNEWHIVETQAFTRMYAILSDAQAFANVVGVIGDAGCGKTEAIKSYAANHHNTYVLSCSEFWNRKHFMIELLRTMGQSADGSVSDLMGEIITSLKRTDKPMIIFDEVDKLTDQVLHFFITLYNALEGHCAIIFSATDYLEKRIKRGVRLNKRGYKEVYSRLGRRFIPLQVVNAEDIAKVCMANGLEERQDIKQVIEDSEFDLRRVKRKIFAIKRLNSAA